MAAQGKRRAATASERRVQFLSEQLAPNEYQGRRAAPKSRGIKLPVLSVPSVTAPILRKPAFAASVALAGIVGVSSVAVATHTSSLSQQASATDLKDLVKAQKATTVSSSTADEAVMSAAEVLNSAAALAAQDDAIEQASEELEALLAEISEQATAKTARDGSSASRSFARSSLAENVDPEAHEESEAAGTSAPSPSASDAATDISSLLDDEELAITVRASGSAVDEPVYTVPEEAEASEGETSAATTVPSDAVVEEDGSVTVDASSVYEAKHAAGGKHAADTDANVQTESSTGRESQPASANTVTVPTGEEVAAVEVNDTTLDSVIAATKRLQTLLDSHSNVEVVSAEEMAKTELEKTWESALAVTEKVGSYSNGQIPLSALSELETALGQYLRGDAAIMFAEMNKAFRAQFGRDIKMTDSYRSYALQVATKANKGWLAAAPGTSNHGWGLALDLAGPEAQWNTAQRNWLVNNSETYGWITPDWANSSKPEPWHWEFAGADVSAVGSKVSVG